MNRPLLSALLGLLACSPLLTAAPGDASPSMNPGATPAKESKNPFGFSGMGKERPKDAKTEITAQKEATFDNSANQATFEGSVVVKDPQFTMFCERLVVTLGKERKGMELTEAFGKVIIIQENTDANGQIVKSTCRAGKAVYQPDTGNITLTESPSIQSGINVQIGDVDTVMILNGSGVSKTKGASKTVIVDTSENNQQ